MNRGEVGAQAEIVGEVNEQVQEQPVLHQIQTNGSQTTRAELLGSNESRLSNEGQPTLIFMGQDQQTVQKQPSPTVNWEDENLSDQTVFPQLSSEFNFTNEKDIISASSIQSPFNYQNLQETAFKNNTPHIEVVVQADQDQAQSRNYGIPHRIIQSSENQLPDLQINCPLKTIIQLKDNQQLMHCQQIKNLKQQIQKPSKNSSKDQRNCSQISQAFYFDDSRLKQTTIEQYYNDKNLPFIIHMQESNSAKNKKNNYIEQKESNTIVNPALQSNLSGEKQNVQRSLIDSLLGYEEESRCQINSSNTKNRGMNEHRIEERQEQQMNRVDGTFCSQQIQTSQIQDIAQLQKDILNLNQNLHDHQERYRWNDYLASLKDQAIGYLFEAEENQFINQIKKYVQLRFYPKALNSVGQKLLQNGVILSALVRYITRQSENPSVPYLMFQNMKSTFILTEQAIVFSSYAKMAKQQYEKFAQSEKEKAIKENLAIRRSYQQSKNLKLYGGIVYVKEGNCILKQQKNEREIQENYHTRFLLQKTDELTRQLRQKHKELEEQILAHSNDIKQLQLQKNTTKRKSIVKKGLQESRTSSIIIESDEKSNQNDKNKQLQLQLRPESKLSPKLQRQLNVKSERQSRYSLHQKYLNIQKKNKEQQQIEKQSPSQQKVSIRSKKQSRKKRQSLKKSQEKKNSSKKKIENQQFINNQFGVQQNIKKSIQKRNSIGKIEVSKSKKKETDQRTQSQSSSNTASQPIVLQKKIKNKSKRELRQRKNVRKIHF